MTKAEFAKLLENRSKEQKLVTEKHDPAKLTKTRNKPRTVIAADLAPQLPQFIGSMDYEVTHYEHRDFGSSPDYWEIKPTTSTFSIPGSGVPAHSATPKTQCDRLIVVSGSAQGLHIFSESRAEIVQKIKSGQLKNPQPLT